MLSAPGSVWPALLASRLGACWKCMGLCFLLLAVSLMALLASLELLTATVVLTSIASGFFAVLSTAHVMMFFVRRVIRSRQRQSYARLARLAGRCCE